MPKNARIIHKELAYKLEKRGYGLPAKYIVEWNPHMNGWVGILQEVPKAPILKRKKKEKNVG